MRHTPLFILVRSLCVAADRQTDLLQGERPFLDGGESPVVTEAMPVALAAEERQRLEPDCRKLVEQLRLVQ